MHMQLLNENFIKEKHGNVINKEYTIQKNI
jgi:hypothetical protein